MKKIIIWIATVLLRGTLLYLLLSFLYNSLTLNGILEKSLGKFISEGMLDFITYTETGAGFFDFVRLISIFGTFILGFYQTIVLSSSLADGARNMIKAHSKRILQYHLSFTHLIVKSFLEEFILFAGVIFIAYGVNSAVEVVLVDILPIFYLLLAIGASFIIGGLVSRNSLSVVLLFVLSVGLMCVFDILFFVSLAFLLAAVLIFTNLSYILRGEN